MDGVIDRTKSSLSLVVSFVNFRTFSIQTFILKRHFIHSLKRHRWILSLIKYCNINSVDSVDIVKWKSYKLNLCCIKRRFMKKTLKTFLRLSIQKITSNRLFKDNKIKTNKRLDTTTMISNQLWILWLVKSVLVLINFLRRVSVYECQGSFLHHVLLPVWW